LEIECLLCGGESSQPCTRFGPLNDSYGAREVLFHRILHSLSLQRPPSVTRGPLLTVTSDGFRATRRMDIGYWPEEFFATHLPTSLGFRRRDRANPEKEMRIAQCSSLDFNPVPPVLFGFNIASPFLTSGLYSFVR
jgi:hypothetical protein